VTSRGAPYLSIIIPAFNEVGFIGNAVNSIAARMATIGFTYEIIVMEAGCSDETRREAAAEAGRFDPHGRCGDIAAWSRVHILECIPSRGRGFALRRGAAESRGRFIALMDADLPVCPSYLAAFLVEAAAGADLVMSSRCLPGSFNHGSGRWIDKTVARLLGKAGGRILGFGGEGSDLTCGLTMLRGETGRTLLARAACDGWGLDAELLFLADRAALSISALPVMRREREGFRRNKPLKAIGFLKELLKVRAHAARGDYGPGHLPALVRGAVENSGAGGAFIPPGLPSGLPAQEGTEAGAGVGDSNLRDLLRRS
jgi:dolichyl-phosphate beta-glucosyltransferase